MNLNKSGRYIDIFYAKTRATTKISTLAGYLVVLATLLLNKCRLFLKKTFDMNPQPTETIAKPQVYISKIILVQTCLVGCQG